MEIRRVLALRGPNVWARFPVLEAWVDLGEWKDTASDEMPGFNERLMSWLPTLIEHRCSVGTRGGFFERLRRGTYLAHILEHVTLELQTLAGSDVGFGRARESNEEGVYKVAIEYEEEALGRAAVESGRALCLAAVRGESFDVAGEVSKLREIYLRVKLGPSTGAIVEAARGRGIPVQRLNEDSLVQLGHGSKQRRIVAAETDRTSAIAEAIAQDKELTRSLLSRLGVPVPHGRPVTSAEDAWAAAEEVGLPVVVKPQYGNHGRGVATNLETREQVIAAYEAARAHGSSVIVETFAPGQDYRVLVVGNRVAAAARRDPAQVVGDGHSTVRELVEAVNRDPRRAEGHATILSKISLDANALGVLADQGMTEETVPSAGQRVLIRRNANLSTGGTATDVTDRVHPEVVARSVEAARIVGLDIAGIDLVCRDISRPLEEQGGVIVEVNAGPGLRMHLAPSEGSARPVGEAIVDLLFPKGETGRIRIVGVTGVNGKTTVTRFIAHLAMESDLKVGMTCTDGIYVGLRRIEAGDCSGPASARAVLSHPDVELAVFETARGGILRAGLAFEACDVAVVTNIGDGDHLGLHDIDTVEKLARVKRTLVEAVSPEGWAVLNAADPLVAAMAEHCAGSVCFFALSEEEAALRAHRERGGRALFVREGVVILAEGPQEERFIHVSDVPLAAGGRVGFQVENVLAGIGAAWVLGLDREAVSAAAQSFASDMHTVPGRFNLLEIDGATVVIDYGHNASALRALVQAIAPIPCRRRVAVYSVAGDRRDQDIFEQGLILGEAFDVVYLYEDNYRRGRAEGEIIALLKGGIAASAAGSRSVTEIHGSDAATVAAIADLRPGDVLLIQADHVDQTMGLVRSILETRRSSREIAVPAGGDGTGAEAPMGIAWGTAARVGAPVPSTTEGAND